MKHKYLIFYFCGVVAPLFPVTTATWNVNANGNWNLAGNWLSVPGGVFPNGTGDVANFGNVPAQTATRTITLGIPITIGTVTIDNTRNFNITANTLTFQVSAGTASLTVTTVNGAGAHSIASGVSLQSTLNMSTTSTANFTISGAISGPGGIIKNGTGTGSLILSNGTNSYGGTTTINKGNVTYGAAGAIPAANAVTIGDGSANPASLLLTVSMGSGNAFPATINSNGTIAPNTGISTFLSSVQGNGAITLGGGTANFNVGGGGSTTFAGTITGGAASGSTDPAAANRFTKTGGSTLTLTGTSSYISRTFIAEGIVVAQSSGALGAIGPNSAVYVRAIGTQGSLNIDGNGLVLNKTLFLNGAGFISNGALRSLGGNNTVSGNVQIGWTGGTETPATAATIKVDPTTQLTLSAIVSGSSNLDLVGSGTLIYSGINANTLSGLTTINAGTLQLSKTGVVAVTNGVTIPSPGTLTTTATNQFGNASIVTLSGGTFNMLGNIQTVGSLVYNTGTFTQGGATLSMASVAATALSMQDVTITGNLAFTAAGGVTYTPNTGTGALISGNLNLGGNTAHVFTINDGAAAVDMNISGVISGTGAAATLVVNKSAGTGVLRFSGAGANTYTGTTNVSAGELQLSKSSGTVAIGGALTISTGGTVTLLADMQIIDTSNVTMTGGILNLNTHPETIARLVFNTGSTLTQGGALLTLTGNGGGTFTMGDSTSITGNIAMTGTGTITKTGAVAPATMSGNLDLGTQIHSVVIASGSSMVMSGVVSGTGGITRITTTGGVLQFSGSSSNTYTGLTTPSFGDILLSKTGGAIAIAGDITFNDSSGSLTLGGNEQIADTSAMNLTSGTFNMAGFNETIGSLSFNSGTLNQAGGTLSLASAGTALSIRGGLTISGPLKITGGGTVLFNTATTGIATISGPLNVGSLTPTFNIPSAAPSTQMNITGVISGSAGLTKNGTSLLQFAAGSSNLYTGLTTVSAGTLQLNMPGFTAINGDVLINGGTLSLNAAEQIANTSLVTLTSGTFDLAGFAETIGTLNYQGGTLAQGGAVLTMASSVTALSMRGGLTIVGPLAVTGGGAIVFDATNNGTATISGPLNLGGITPTFNTARGTAARDMVVSGVITSSGAGLIKAGAGLLEFSGSGTVGGTTFVNGGTLFVNGTLGGAGAMIVASGATLGGTGTIAKNVTVNGNLLPGNSIGTIHLIGAQTLAAGSKLEIELNPSTSDLVDIVGTLAIQAGSTLSILPDPGQYPASFLYTIVQTTGGVTGTFSAVTSPSIVFAGSVVYTPLDVLLELTVIPFSHIVGSGNAASLAGCLDLFAAPAGSDAESVIHTLRLLPTKSAMEDALLQMQPSAFTALAIAMEDDILYVSNAILNRLDTFSHSCDLENNKRNHFWATALGGFTHQSSKQQEPGFHATSPGVALGFDGEIGKHFCLGVNLSYTYTTLHWAQQRGQANMQGVSGGLYGKWFDKRGYLEGALMGGYDFYNTNRHIQFSSINRHAKGFHRGYEGSAHVKGALTFDRNHTIISPYSRLDYLYVHENRFSETGAQSLNLHINSKNSDLLSAEAGLDLSHCFEKEGKTITPFVQVSGIWENRFLGDKEEATLDGSCFITAKGLNPSRGLVGASVGLNALFLCSQTTLSVFYRGKYGSGFQDNSLYAQIVKEF